MILAFVGAGIMTMESAIGVILGPNITGWIVVTVGFKMNIEALALPLTGSWRPGPDLSGTVCPVFKR